MVEISLLPLFFQRRHVQPSAQPIAEPFIPHNSSIGSNTPSENHRNLNKLQTIVKSECPIREQYELVLFCHSYNRFDGYKVTVTNT